jgi:predicted HicB family RNase H-like nuclease
MPKGGKREGAGKPLGWRKPEEQKAVTISLSMSGELHRQLKSKAESAGITVNDAIRDAVRRWISDSTQR